MPKLIMFLGESGGREIMTSHYQPGVFHAQFWKPFLGLSLPSIAHSKVLWKTPSQEQAEQAQSTARFAREPVAICTQTKV
jgi:hypothetical protein